MSTAHAEALSGVGDDQAQAAAAPIQPDRRLARVRVLADVGQCLAGDPEHLGFHLARDRTDVGDVHPDAYPGVGRELARQRGEGFGQRSILERRSPKRANGSPGLVQALTRGVERLPQRGPRAVAPLEPRQARFDVQRDRRESLRHGIVEITRDTGALVRPRMLDRLLAEARALDGHADLIRDGRQQIQLLSRQPPPAAHREVHDAERPIARIERNARVASQAPGQRRLRRPHRRRQPAALDHVDVPRRQLPAAKELEAPARPAGHPYRFLEVRRQVLYGGAVKTVGRRIAEPHPAGFDAEQSGHAAERLARRPLFGRRAVECFGHFLEDAQRSRFGEAAVGLIVPAAH